MNTGTPLPKQHLQDFVTARLPQLVPGIFDGAPDYPFFTVDQRYSPPQELPYPVG